MSVEAVMRQLIRDEVERAIAPLHAAIEQLTSQGNLAAQLTALLGGNDARRGPGRPVKLFATGGGKKLGRPAGAGGKVACAVIGCRRPVRSKGYCAAHYQKLRNLIATRRRPADWTDSPAPHTVKDIVLPRGRAGAKALAALKK